MTACLQYLRLISAPLRSCLSGPRLRPRPGAAPHAGYTGGTLALGLGLALAACGNAGSPPAPVLSEVRLGMAEVGLADVASFDLYRDGARIHLLAAGTSRDGETPELRYIRSDDGGESWSEPTRPGLGQPAPTKSHRGNDVQVAAHGRQVVALWGTNGSGFRGSGPFVSAISSDGGQSWRAGPNPAADGTDGGHGFADLIAAGDGVFHLAWLDSYGVVTNDRGVAEVAASDAVGGQQGLMAARSDDGGASWVMHRRVDDVTCECCWNSLTESGGGVHLLYRDKDPRDMALASLDAGAGWRTGGRVGAFDWRFEGCPHVGGALAAGGDTLTALVWTGHAERIGLYALSRGADADGWSSPVALGDDSARHSDLAHLSDGRALAVWDQNGESGRRILLAAQSPQGDVWSSATPLPGASGSVTHPRIVPAADGGALVAWSAQSGGSGAPRGIALARVALSP